MQLLGSDGHDFAPYPSIAAKPSSP